ncbi:hypothetical protein CSHISOI_11748, partial [Colletotrichum shisoi]
MVEHDVAFACAPGASRGRTKPVGPCRDLNNNNELQLPPRFANTGDGEDGKFTFGQFQARILGIDPKNMPPEDAEKYNSLKAPWSDPDGRTPTIHDVTQRLMEVGLNQRFLVTEFDPTLQRQRFHRTMGGLGRYPPLYDPADPFRTPYSYLIDRIEAQFQKYRAEAGPQHAAVLKKNNDLGLEILRCVVTLRKEDTMKHVFAQMQRDVDDELRPGLSIPLELISVNLEEPSQVPGGKMYPKVRVGITMQNAWNDRATREQLQRKGFTDVEQLYSWANDIGDPT